MLITDALDSGLWTVLPDDDTYDSLDIDTIKANLDTALTAYAEAYGEIPSGIVV